MTKINKRWISSKTLLIVAVVVLVAIAVGFVLARKPLFAPPPGASCIDSDGGINIYVKGTLSWSNTSNMSYPATDICKNGNTLSEYYCSSGGSVSVKTVKCPANYVCSNGACVYPQNQTNQTHLTCVGNLCTTVQGAGTNTCSPAGSACGQTNLSCSNFGYQYGTVGGICNNTNGTRYDLSRCYNQNRTCTDHDAYLGAPEYYYIFSNATGTVYTKYGPDCDGTGSGSAGGFARLDKCLDSIILDEAICNADKIASGVNYTCSSGCAGGKCNRNQTEPIP